MKRKAQALRLVPASQVKNNFGEVIKRVYEKEEAQIIERAGLPVAAIVSMSDLERLYPDQVRSAPKVASSTKRQQAWRRLRKIVAEMQKGNEKFSEDEVDADVLRVVEQVRYGKRAR